MLTGIAAFLKARVERKRVLASALADLLEVRHRVVAADLVVKELRTRFGMSAAAAPLIRNMLDAVHPLDDALVGRYEKAVSLLAGVDPLQAFELRSKAAFPKVLSILRAQATGSGGDMALFEAFEVEIRSAATPSLNEAVTRLALSHSLRSWWKVRALVRKSATLPPDVTAFFERMQALANPQSKSGPSDA